MLLRDPREPVALSVVCLPIVNLLPPFEDSIDFLKKCKFIVTQMVSEVLEKAIWGRNLGVAIKEDCFGVPCQIRSALQGWSRATASLPVLQSSRPRPGIEPATLASGSLPLSHLGSPKTVILPVTNYFPYTPTVFIVLPLCE